MVKTNENVLFTLTQQLEIHSGESIPAKLDLSNCGERLTDARVQQLCKHGWLQQDDLRLSGNLWLRRPFQNVSEGGLVRYIDLSQCIRLETQGILDVCRAFPNLLRLDLSCCYQATDEAAFAIAISLRNLEELSLDGCTQITDEGLSSIVHSLGPQLKSINISGLVEVSSNSLVNRNKATWKALEEFRAVGCIGLDNWGLERVLAQCEAGQIRVWHVSGIRKVTDQGFMQHADVFSHARDIDVSGCYMLTGLFLEALKKSGCVELNVLGLEACAGIPSQAVTSFAKMFPQVEVRTQARMTRLDEGLIGISWAEVRHLLLWTCKITFVTAFGALSMHVVLGVSWEWIGILACSVFCFLFAYYFVAVGLLVLGSGL